MTGHDGQLPVVYTVLNFPYQRLGRGHMNNNNLTVINSKIWDEHSTRNWSHEGFTGDPGQRFTTPLFSEKSLV